MKIKLFCDGDMGLIQNQVNGFLESLISDNPRDQERVVDIKFAMQAIGANPVLQDNEIFSVMVIYK
jgi:hypothetical protein